ncbi:MAG TPA: DUF1835 domain-containing protein [Parasegetibacter sp.]
MIHVVFSTDDAKLLQEVTEMDESLQGSVIAITDQYAVGPIANIYTGEGISARKAWWSEVSPELVTDAEEDGNNADHKTVAELVGTLRWNPDEVLWIWAAQNKHDVCGYYWLLHFVKEFQGRVFILYLNNLPFINEKGLIFYPSWLNEIPPREFLKAKKLARAITLSEFEIDPDEWKKLCDDNAVVRILEGGKKIVSKEADYYDKNILSNITNEWQKASRVILNVVNRSKMKGEENFIAWRIRRMIAEGKLEANGKVEGNWKEFEVKFPAQGTQVGATEPAAAEGE